jgi:hypothetical protein
MIRLRLIFDIYIPFFFFIFHFFIFIVSLFFLAKAIVSQYFFNHAAIVGSFICIFDFLLFFHLFTIHGVFVFHVDVLVEFLFFLVGATLFSFYFLFVVSNLLFEEDFLFAGFEFKQAFINFNLTHKTN